MDVYAMLDAMFQLVDDPEIVCTEVNKAMVKAMEKNPMLWMQFMAWRQMRIHVSTDAAARRSLDAIETLTEDQS
jgi:hypothetical protein